MTTGVVLVASRTLPGGDGLADRGVTVVTRIGPGSKTASPSSTVPVAGSPRAVCQRSTAAAVAAV